MKAVNVKISSQSLHKLQQQLSLREGQVIKAEVVQIKGKKILLKIGTTILNAETKVPLQKGENLQLLVELLKDNFIKLKIIPEGETIKRETIMLSRLGVKPQENLEQTAQQLLKFKMPLAKEILGEISTIVKRHNLPKEILPLVVWLKSVGLKLDTKEDLQEIKNMLRFFKGELSSQEETKFFRLLNESESTILGGYNIYGWPLDNHHLYLLTSNSKGERIRPESCTVIIKMASQAFGDLWFKINYLGNTLKISITCNNELHKKVLEGEVALLQKGLQAIGYRVSEVKVETEEIDTVFDLIPIPLQEIKGVNYKV